MNFKSEIFKRKSTLIFLFHGVNENEKFDVINYTNKHINYKKFEEYLKFFKKNGYNLSIDELVYCLSNNINPPDNSYVITFDDGFKNNLTVASEILDKHNLKATFYLTTNFIENNENSWIDEIEFFVENNPFYEIELENKKISFTNNLNSKINFLNKIRKIIKGNINIDSDYFKKFFKKKNLISSKNYPSIFEKMSWQDVQKLLRNPLFTIGGHSHGHKIFTSMKEKEMQNDINKSIFLFKKRLNLNLRHYSYPEGLKNTYSNREIKFLKKNKIICCPSAIFGNNFANTNLFDLKRINCS